MGRLHAVHFVLAILIQFPARSSSLFSPSRSIPSLLQWNDALAAALTPALREAVVQRFGSDVDAEQLTECKE